MQTYQGQCHCGKVQFEANFELNKPYQCNCSLCKRRNAVMHRIPKGNLRITQGNADLSLYQFHTKVAKHHFCKHCGIFVYARPRTSDTEMAINLHCIDADYSNISAHHLDGKSFD